MVGCFTLYRVLFIKDLNCALVHLSFHYMSLGKREYHLVLMREIFFMSVILVFV